MALGKAWQPTFNAKTFPPELSKRYLEELGDIGCYSNCTAPPNYWAYQKAIKAGPNSMPGPDGISYQAWRASREWGIANLRGVDDKLRSGSEPDSKFNSLCMSFRVKGEDDHDTVAVLSGPLNTRLLCMENFDNKITASAICLYLIHI